MSEPQIIHCKQGSPEWLAVRRGVPTSSEFGKILTPKTMELSAQADKYIALLISDVMRHDYGHTVKFKSRSMERGLEFEDESRSYYELVNDIDVTRVGFIISADGRFGSSTDGLIGEDGVLEMKNPDPDTHTQWLMEGVLPNEHKNQCHGSLIVTGRKYCDFISYYPGLPPLIVRVTPDEFTKKLEAALDKFWDRYQMFLDKISSMNK